MKYRDDGYHDAIEGEQGIVWNEGFGAWVLRVLLGTTFLLTGAVNLFGMLNTPRVFALDGLWDVGRVVVGVVEVLASILLLVPGVGAFGAAGLLALFVFLTFWRALHARAPMTILSFGWAILSAWTLSLLWPGRLAVVPRERFARDVDVDPVLRRDVDPVLRRDVDPLRRDPVRRDVDVEPLPRDVDVDPLL